MKFKHFPVGSAVGTGDYVFRHFGSEQPVGLDYLCFTAQEANSSVTLNKVGTLTKGQAFETSTDGTAWTPYTFGTSISLPSVGDKVYWRGDNETVSESAAVRCTFSGEGKIAASGNIMSLLDKTCVQTEILSNRCFNSTFLDCTALISAPRLPSTELTTSCYGNMFNGCSNLAVAPALPATNLQGSCYIGMFRNCTSLTTIPVLPATVLMTSCYNSMFKGCTSIAKAVLPPTVMVTDTCSSMFDGCTSLNDVTVAFADWGASGANNWLNNVSANGTFYCPSALPDIRGANYIPDGWTIVRTD